MTKKNDSTTTIETFPRHNKFVSDVRKHAASWFLSKNKPTHKTRAYSLESKDLWQDNIICAEVSQYIEKERKIHSTEQKFYPLHSYIHHGLSSQAMLFNLVGPLITRNDLKPLQIVVEKAGLTWADGLAEFEYDNEDIFKENRGQPTSIDLAILGDTGKIFIEAKFVEKEFGSCSVFKRGDCDGRNPLIYGYESCYLHNLKRPYWTLMKEFGFGNKGATCGPICPFINYYQFYREVMFAVKEKGSFLLLHDERNPAFLKKSTNGKISGLWPFLIESIPSKHTASIGRITIQQLVKEIKDSSRHTDWINEFKSKYGIN